MIGRVFALAGAAVLCAWAFFHWVYRPQRCSIDVTTLTRRTNSAIDTASDFERTVRARRNLEDLSRMSESCASDVRVPVLAAANQSLLGRHEDARLSYQAALRIERRPEIYADLAESLIVSGKIEEAVEYYTAVVRFAGDVTVVPSPEFQERLKERLRGAR